MKLLRKLFQRKRNLAELSPGELRIYLMLTNGRDVKT